MAERPLGDLAGARVDGPRPHGASVDELGRIVWLRTDDEDRRWRRLAACTDMDPAVFFPVGTTGAAVEQIAAAKAVCHRCPVRLACLQYALVSHQEDGVWGGHSEEERRELRRRWRRLGRPLRIVPGAPLHGSGADVGGWREDPAPEAG